MHVQRQQQQLQQQQQHAQQVQQLQQATAAPAAAVSAAPAATDIPATQEEQDQQAKRELQDAINQIPEDADSELQWLMMENIVKYFASRLAQAPAASAPASASTAPPASPASPAAPAAKRRKQGVSNAVQGNVRASGSRAVISGRKAVDDHIVMIGQGSAPTAPLLPEEPVAVGVSESEKEPTAIVAPKLSPLTRKREASIEDTERIPPGEQSGPEQ